MANQHSIHRCEQNGTPLTGHNAGQLPLELSRQRRQGEDPCEALTENQERPPRSTPTRARNLKR